MSIWRPKNSIRTQDLPDGERTLLLRHRLLELFDSFWWRNYHKEIPLRPLRMLMGRDDLISTCVDLKSTCLDLLFFGLAAFWFWFLTFFLLCLFFSGRAACAYAPAVPS